MSATASPGTSCPKRSVTTADRPSGSAASEIGGGTGHRATLIVDGLPVETLEDIAPQPGRLLFVGLNPSPVSVAAGHYHQGRLGRLFWRRLAEARILSGLPGLPGLPGPPAHPGLSGDAGRPGDPSDARRADLDVTVADDLLAAAGHGITDLLKTVTPRDVATDADLRAGVGPLWQRIALWRPAAVVFIYKRAAEAAAGRSLRESWGQLEGVALGGRPCFLMPGPYAPRDEVAEGLNFLRNLGASLPR